MSGDAIATVILALVVLQRLGELVLAQRNTKALLARGAVEIGAQHYPLIVAAACGLAGRDCLCSCPIPRRSTGGWSAVFVVLQGLRVWVLATLGPYWTTRIISLPGAPLVKRGPYRFVRHPNYLVVAGEIAGPAAGVRGNRRGGLFFHRQCGDAGLAYSPGRNRPCHPPRKLRIRPCCAIAGRSCSWPPSRLFIMGWARPGPSSASACCWRP